MPPISGLRRRVARVTRATGAPRLVTTTDAPAATSSRMPRHFALNSVAQISLSFHFDYRCYKMTSQLVRLRSYLG